MAVDVMKELVVHSQACDFLRAHHAHIAALIEEVKQNPKQTLLSELFIELRIHSILEQQLFYPAFREVIGKDSIRLAASELYGLLVVMLELEQSNLASDQFAQLFAKIVDRFDQHVFMQESRLFLEIEEQRRYETARLEDLHQLLLAQLNTRRLELSQNMQRVNRKPSEHLCLASATKRDWILCA